MLNSVNLNKAFLCKWNLRFTNEREALWNQVIRGKYGEERGGWCSREVREAHSVGLWKGIRMDWDFVGSRISFLVGNGWRVRFWRDRWCRDSPLCVSFPSLFALTDDKEAWVADIWDSLVEGEWGLGWGVSQEPSMIGRWRRQKASWSGCMGRECVEMWKAWCFGPKQRVESSRSNPSTML